MKEKEGKIIYDWKKDSFKEIMIMLKKNEWRNKEERKMHN